MDITVVSVICGVLFVEKCRKVWNNVYATTFTGKLEGNAKTASYADKAKADNNGNQIDTTYAPIASPTFTGTPKAPTATAGTKRSKYDSAYSFPLIFKTTITGTFFVLNVLK